MTDMTETIIRLITIAFVTIFAENTIFSRAFGTSTLIMVSKRRSKLLIFGLCITFMTTCTCFIAFFADSLTKSTENIALFRPMIYVAIIGVVYIATLVLLWRFANRKFTEIKKYVHLSAFNCAVLGALFLSNVYADTLPEYMIFGFGTGMGFMLAAYFVVIVYDRLCSRRVPLSFRGFPLIMAYMGIIGMAFYGLLGHRLSF